MNPVTSTNPTAVQEGGAAKCQALNIEEDVPSTAAVQEGGTAKRRALNNEEDVPCIRGLMAGALFLGVQQSGRATYAVEVCVQHVDIKNEALSGYLKIAGLTDEFPELTTFFEGEIVGHRHSFLTQKWDADETTDREVSAFTDKQYHLKPDSFFRILKESPLTALEQICSVFPSRVWKRHGAGKR